MKEGIIMLSDREFDEAFSATGARFFVSNYEYISDNVSLVKTILIDALYPLGYDANRNGTSTRISSFKKLLNDNNGIKALKKVASSSKLDKDSITTAQRILKERFEITVYK